MLYHDRRLGYQRWLSPLNEMEIGIRLRKGNRHLRLTQILLPSRKNSEFDISQQLTAYFIMTGTERLAGLLLIECFRF